MSNPRQSLVALYADRVARHGSEAERLAASSRRLSNLRGLSFAVFVVAGMFSLFGSAGTSGAALSAAALVVFVVLVLSHAKVLAREDYERRRTRVNQDAHARATGAWRGLPQAGELFYDARHQFSVDLDLFGRASLFQRVSVAHTRFGQARLADLFLRVEEAEAIRARQEAVRALAPELELRQELETLALGVLGPGRGSGPALPPNPEPLLAWAESEPMLSRSTLLAVASKALPVAALAALGGIWLGAVPGFVILAPLIAQLLLIYSTRNETGRVFTAVSTTEGAFLRYGSMLELCERLSLDAELLGALRNRLLEGGVRPSAAMHAFRRAVGWFDLRHNGLVHPVVNLLLLWDVNCVLMLERWQQAYGRLARGWFEALGELEALSSLAGLYHDEPGYCFAEIHEAAPAFEAEALGHPLIDSDARVANDVGRIEAGHGLLVTGSNMSGKSTFLRSLGLGAVMGLAGGPVCATRLSIAPFKLKTSIRISDSLEGGISHFYAELNKLKDAVVAAHENGAPVLFLLDEILHGTNSRERRIGARWLIAELLRLGALGAVSTHDLALCELSGELAQRLELVHFRESVQGDRMTFDFKLRPGPVTAGNALRLMRTVGLDVPLDSS